MAGNSSSAFQLNDGKMLSIVEVLHNETDRDPILSSGLKAGPFLLDIEVHAHGSLSFERLVRAVLVVPVDVERYLHSNLINTKRNQDASRAFVFHGADQSFDDGDAAIFADGAEALLYRSWRLAAPCPERVRGELFPLVALWMPLKFPMLAVPRANLCYRVAIWCLWRKRLDRRPDGRANWIEPRNTNGRIRPRRRDMKQAISLLTLVVLAGLATETAWAHRLVEDDGSHTDAANAIAIEDVDLSQVVYHEVSAESNQLWTTFQVQAGANLYWQLGLPAVEGLEDYRPAIVVLGPGLPVVDVPFDVPDGLGGVVIETAGLPYEVYDEHFTGTVDWIVREEDRILADEGRYYLVAYHPDGTPGKFWIAIGRREDLSLYDIYTYADVIPFVRAYHEVEDERLPLLPSVLLFVSRLVRLLLGPFVSF